MSTPEEEQDMNLIESPESDEDFVQAIHNCTLRDLYLADIVRFSWLEWKENGFMVSASTPQVKGLVSIGY